MTHPLQGIAPLPHLGVIRAEGEEAARFLQGQLTQDFALLPPGQARLAAYCTAKGRMLASFVAVPRAPGEILLVCSADLLAATLKRLSMFVLRAKVRLTNASAAWRLAGLAGGAATAAWPEDAEPWTLRTDGQASLVRLPSADGTPRLLWVAPADSAPPAGPPLDEAVWRWGEVRSGVATLGAAVSEAFVPQMLNYESVGGVNFKKGCYPGQEVVARSQYRGTLKRRAFVVHVEAPMAAGQEVFQAADPSQPAGLIAQAAPAPAGGWDAIASLQLAAVEVGGLHLGAADGPALALLPLPYRLLEDV